ncbi:MAG TPA: DNA-3-methyladenine glycosylase [Candidatus Paceibacterota bacterium]|nr:DNA-3-methyladenine glycosylase [Verrucomicrobiota bacterium]HSA12003.1 DNA-3-methyladenine glycosylase [Candidatus Paceibacterota bacterium]
MTSTFRALPRRLYEPSAAAVAPALLGHWLVRRTADGLCGGLIVETEAYLADDPACHGAPGPTARNRAMFGEPGHAYVYFIYGNHYCMNAVCRPAGVAEAVLIRAVETNLGEKLMRERRPVEATRNLTNGPGKLCLAMDIERDLDGADLCNAQSPVFIARNPAAARFRRERGPLVATRRVGLTKAADLPLRFYLAGSAFVSQRKLGQSR